jgi:hypothetical protein
MFAWYRLGKRQLLPKVQSGWKKTIKKIRLFRFFKTIYWHWLLPPRPGQSKQQHPPPRYLSTPPPRTKIWKSVSVRFINHLLIVHWIKGSHIYVLQVGAATKNCRIYIMKISSVNLIHLLLHSCKKCNYRPSGSCGPAIPVLRSNQLMPKILV